MSVTLNPNMEALVGKWLREHTAIIALGARVATRTPDATLGPWIRITQLDATDSPRSAVEHLIEYFLQLDCFAGKAATDAHRGQMEAWELKATARAVLKAVQGEATDGVVVTEVRFNGDARIPDTTTEPARERYILQTVIRAHGVPGA